MFKAMDGLPVVIRLIDPPLHEFLPSRGPAVATATGKAGTRPRPRRKIWLASSKAIHEDNPMLGLRGCRLLLVYPEILEMQIRAILDAAAAAAARSEHEARDHDAARRHDGRARRAIR